MMIRLIRASTLERLHRTIDGLQRDLAHVSTDRDRVRHDLDRHMARLRETERSARVLAEENDRLIALVAEMHALLSGDVDEDDEQPEVRH